MKTLQQENCWCLWRAETRNGKTTKVPYQINGRRAKVDDPNTWTDYDTATAMTMGSQSGYNGLGLFFHGNLCGIDIDAHGEGENPLALEILELFTRTYIERSPSGRGYHILFRVDPKQLPTITGKDGRRAWNPAYYIKNDKAGLEFYAGGLTRRYFTYTGKQISASDEITDQTDELLFFLDKYMQRDSAQEAIEAPQEAAEAKPSSCEIDLAERLRMARSAKDGDKFRALYDHSGGELPAGYDSQSNADEALCCLLAFWLDGRAELIDEAFRKSGLYRPKWDEKRGAQTYGEMTIAKALERVKTYYQPRKAPTMYKPDLLTDTGNAQKFAEWYSGSIRWCANANQNGEAGWYAWDGMRWENDGNAVGRIAQSFSKGMLLEAVKLFKDAQINASTESSTSVDEAAKAYLKHAQSANKAGNLRGYLNLAKNLLAIPSASFDEDPYALNTKAGIVDLRTGAVRPHAPEAFCTKLAPFTPSTEGAEMWDAFLDLVCCEDQDLKKYLQLTMGMSIIGRVTEESLLIAYGGGRNGKSTFFNALGIVLGDYAGTINADAVTNERGVNRDNQFATLRGKRLVTCGELEEGQGLSIKSLKRISSTDKLVIKRLYYDPEEIVPSHHLCMFTNHLPKVRSTDGGTLRRLPVVPFKAVMPSGKAEIKNYAEELANKAGGAILKWLIDGAVAYTQGGEYIERPQVVEDATREYREREDWLRHFTDECCELDPNARTEAGRLYAAYRAFSSSRGEYTRRLNDFSAALASLGLENIKPRNRSTWVGIRLLEADPSSDFYAADPDEGVLL